VAGVRLRFRGKIGRYRTTLWAWGEIRAGEASIALPCAVPNLKLGVREEHGMSISIRGDDAGRKHLRAALPGPLEKRLYPLFGCGRNGSQRRQDLFTHGFWLRNLMIALGLLSFLAGIWAIAGFPGHQAT
jgi:hypothetical protein